MLLLSHLDALEGITAADRTKGRLVFSGCHKHAHASKHDTLMAIWETTVSQLTIVSVMAHTALVDA